MNKWFCIKDCITSGINSVNEDVFYYLLKDSFYFIESSGEILHIYSDNNEYLGYLFEEELSNFINIAEWREQQINLILEHE